MIIQPAHRTRSIGEYYFSIKLREIARMNAEGLPVVNMGIGNPDLPPGNSAISALQAAAALPDVHGYQPHRGLLRLRQAFAEWYHRVYHIDLDAKTEVLPLLGSKEGVFYLSMALLDPGDQVLVPDPGYLAYSSAARLAGAEVMTFNLRHDNGWLPELESLKGRDLSSVKMMWINYPNMPTGAVASTQQLDQLIQFATEHHILLCHDNPYSLVHTTVNPVSIMQCDGARICSVELNSLSKSHRMAGWRVGVLVGNPDILDYVLRVKSNVDSGMFRPIQEAAIIALQQDSASPVNVKQIQERISLTETLLETLGCTEARHRSGMYIWARIPDNAIDAHAFVDHILEQHRLFLAPGSIFGKNGERYVRAALCVPAEVIQNTIHRLELINTTA